MRAALRKLGDAARWLAQRPVLCVALAVALVTLLASASAWARVGGGDSFSGSSSSSSGSSDSGSDDLDLVIFLVWLCIEHPYIGIPVTIIVIIVAIVKKSSNAPAKKDWTSGVDKALEEWTPPAQRSARRQLEHLRGQDPQFSIVLFEDFLYALYATAQEARGRDKLDELAPYFTQAARGHFHPRMPGPSLREVKGVVVGSMKVTQVLGLEAASPAVRVRVRFETNFVEVFADAGGRSHEVAMYAVEVWYLSRKFGLISKPPDKARKIGCPNCGAALTDVRGKVCSFCQKTVEAGGFDWRVDNIDLLTRELRPPKLGASSGEEAGTNLPTLTAPDALTNLEALEQRDPAFNVDAFRARVDMIFRELQGAWSQREWLRVRPFVSDNLFQMQLYWIESYRKQGLRNVIDRIEIQRIETAAVSSDACYDALTVRIFATCFDYVVAEDGSFQGGNRKTPSRFSEYWTLIRGVGVKGKASAEKKCPNCGAEQKVSQAGSCEYCQAKITSGEFDWVLSRIEQDEVYAG